MYWHSFWLTLAQATPKPTSVDSATIELLTRQLQFLQDANTRLSSSFTTFVTVVGFLIAGVVGISFWLFKTTLKDARQELKQLVQGVITREIETTVDKRVTYLEQILDRERLLEEITVHYITLKAPSDIPIEYEFLRDRFPRIALKQFDNPIFHNANVIVLDLINNPTGKVLPDDNIRQILKELLNNLDRQRTSIVIYYRGERGQSAAISELDPNLYTIPANSRISLIGSTINAAYIADTLRRKRA
ncbi:MAG: hypothetical protein J0L70_30920 [Leptolyngbya sp. UWPOB_LEPTO1]|uniref:hypothetical protein n=1 Tax=Leptolyngbya sp. UWPOB_LEPTO1 TaxID=2815653 RepID=UPI001AC9AC3A|nr:hypothetical protein [Leptolyngbya sp. UWPOB_LEPTO1]MBN8564930.1 hypothetical protein [Leptolyngbya sp. UWPOB_LEPTO1]